MLVECQRCGAPLDVKDSQRFIQCAYCRATNRVQSLRTMAMQTPPNWQPPPTWHPRDAASFDFRPLQYNAPVLVGAAAATTSGVGCAVAVGVLAVFAGVIGALTAARGPGSGGGLFASRVNAFGTPSLGALVIATPTHGQPQHRSGLAGGGVQATRLAAACRGWVPVAPHLRLEVREAAMVEVRVNSSIDTTLAVQLPGGSWVCDDDSGQGTNPLLNLPLSPGSYPVWVGAYSSGNRAGFTVAVTSSPLGSTDFPMMAGQLGATNFPTPAGAGQAAAPPFGAMPPSGQTTIDAGGRLRMQGMAGGTVPGRAFGNRCTGFYAMAPAHRVTITEPQRLSFTTEGSNDLTAVLRSDTGQVFCDDDGGQGQNPLINATLTPGTWEFFVGTFSSANRPVGFTARGSLSATSGTGAPVGRGQAGPGAARRGELQRRLERERELRQPYDQEGRGQPTAGFLSPPSGVRR